MNDDQLPDRDDGPDSDSGGPIGPRPMTAIIATGWALAATFLVILSFSIVQALRPHAQIDLVTELGCQAVGYLITLFLILRVHAPDAGVRDFVGMRPTNALAYPLAVGLGLALYAPADALFTVILSRFPIEDHLTETFQAATPAMRVAMALCMILAGPVLEELLFRGALFKPLLKTHAPSMVVSVTAILFALGHLTPQTWFPVALLGVVLGFVRWETGSLVPSILVHATFNAVPFYRMAAQRPGAPEPGQLPAWMIGVSGAVALLLVAAFAALGRSKSARLAQEFDLAGVRKR